MNTPSTSMIHVRVNNKIKTQAARTLSKMGLSVSDAVRMLLTRVIAEKAMPFEVRVPNSETIAAMKAAERGEVSKATSIKEMMEKLHADD